MIASLCRLISEEALPPRYRPPTYLSLEGGVDLGGIGLVALTLVIAATDNDPFFPPEIAASTAVAVWVSTTTATMNVLAKRERREGRARRRLRQEAL